MYLRVEPSWATRTLVTCRITDTRSFCGILLHQGYNWGKNKNDTTPTSKRIRIDVNSALKYILFSFHNILQSTYLNDKEQK